MVCVRRFMVLMAMVSLVAVFGCAVKHGGGPQYEFSDGWLIREYKEPLQDTYQAGLHGAHSKFVVVEEASSKDNSAMIAGQLALSGQPVAVQMQAAGPASTLVSVQVGESGNKAAATGIHQALQRYLFP